MDESKIAEGVTKAVIDRTIGGLKAIPKFFKRKPKALPLEEIKKQTRVLFIDDDSFEPLLNAIREGGWNVRQIKDVINPDCEEIKSADIIFVDYKDVGKILTPTEEGIGLLKMLRKKYTKKYLIFLSGYAGFIPGHEFHDIADGWITKSADNFVYLERIENAAKKIYGEI